MAYQAGGTDYRGFLESRRLADTGLTKALDAKGKADKAKRIADSKKRSGTQKILSAVARGAAAYYTGGLSETMGGGEMIDKAMLGADAETNEYGQLVGAASQIGGAMSAQKGMEAAKKLEMQSQKDSAMQTRLDNLDPTGKMGMDFATKREARDSANLKALQAGKKGSFGGLVQGEIQGINYEPTTIGDWEAKLKANKEGLMDIDKPSFIQKEGRGGKGSLIPPPDQTPAALSQGDLAQQLADQQSKLRDASRRQDSQLDTSSAAASSPDASSTYQDWAGNPGSKFVQGGATNRGVHRSSYGK